MEALIHKITEAEIKRRISKEFGFSTKQINLREVYKTTITSSTMMFEVIEYCSFRVNNTAYKWDGLDNLEITEQIERKCTL